MNKKKYAIQQTLLPSVFVTKEKKYRTVYVLDTLALGPLIMIAQSFASPRSRTPIDYIAIHLPSGSAVALCHCSDISLESFLKSLGSPKDAEKNILIKMIKHHIVA